MNKKIVKLIYPLSKKFLRLFKKKYKVEINDSLTKPVAYIVHHQNLKGPFTTMLWLDEKIHPWVLSVFYNQRDCFKHYYEYTFTKRFKIPKLLAAIFAYPISFYIAGLAKSMESIPVYRSSMSILKTFKYSINALSSNESILICPDIDYSNSRNTIGEMYQGFIELERFYNRATLNHLPFVPIYIDEKLKVIIVGNEIKFRDGVNFQEEKKLVFSKIMAEFIRLENKK